MVFEINREAKGDDGVDVIVVTERLCLTEDGRLVPEDDPGSRWLYAIPGHTIPLADAQRYGLVGERPNDAEPGGQTSGETADGDVPPPVKESEPEGDKEAVAVEDKASGLTIAKGSRRKKGGD